MVMDNSLRERFDNEVEKLLNEIAKDANITDYKIEKAGSSMKGDGYLGVITVIEIIGKEKNGKKKKLELVVKTAAKSDALRNEAPISGVFEREIYMYNVIIPAFRNLQIEKGLPPFPSIAKCYKACMINKSETVVMENLKAFGFQLWERRLPMNADHVSFVMSEYGKFHALSYIMKDQDCEKFRKLTNSMDEIFAKFMEKGSFTESFKKQCLKAVDSLNPTTEAEAIRIFKTFSETVPSCIKDGHKLVDEYSVILHGDCWTNNMMFKYEDSKNPRKPTSMRFIDLQMGRLGPPVLDIAYYFYACSSKTVIDNFEHYLDVYYKSLSSYIKQHGSDPEKLYPYSVFRQQWKAHCRFGIICAMLLIHVMLSEQDEVTDLAECAESGKSVIEAFDYSIGKLDEYNDRVRHIILHAVKNKFV